MMLNLIRSRVELTLPVSGYGPRTPFPRITAHGVEVVPLVGDSSEYYKKRNIERKTTKCDTHDCQVTDAIMKSVGDKCIHST